MDSNRLYLGTAWYPEHWPQERWPVDLQLMQAAGMNVVRIGDYAWSRLEPSERQFEIDWMERAVDLAQQHGIHVVIATPTDAPPAWMTQKYPDVLRAEQDGRPTTHGGRRHFNPLSPRYRTFSKTIAEQLVARFGQHPNVIGWQIGNEFCRYSYDELTGTLFQRWLQAKYATLDELNRCWTTAYWSQGYSDWSQIHLPVGWQNPCLDLDFFRFQSQAFADFQLLQTEAIRAKADRRQWITTNIHGSEDLDFTQMIESADIASWDPYPSTHQIDHLDFGWISDFCRTLKPRPHWIMETQSQHKNWAPPNLSLPRGALAGLTWHFFAHAAQAVLYWQWRSPLGGQEQYHGTIIAPDGNPRPHYAEVADIGRDLRRIEPLLAGMHMSSDVAVVYSYVNQFAINRQRHHAQFDPHKHLVLYYGSLRAMALNVDVIATQAVMDRYRLIVAPHLHCLDSGLVERLVQYVQNGGHLLLGARSGFKDQFNAMLPSHQPGTKLAELLGAYVEEHHTLDEAVSVAGTLGEGNATIWAEYLVPTAGDVEVLLSYGSYNGWIDGKPALVSRRVGRGRISYLGTWLDPKLMLQFMAWATSVSGVNPNFPLPPPQVEVCRLNDGDRQLWILINHGRQIQQVSLPRPMRDLLANGNAQTSIELPAYAVAAMVNS